MGRLLYLRPFGGGGAYLRTGIQSGKAQVQEDQKNKKTILDQSTRRFTVVFDLLVKNNQGRGEGLNRPY